MSELNTKFAGPPSAGVAASTAARGEKVDLGPNLSPRIEPFSYGDPVPFIEKVKQICDRHEAEEGEQWDDTQTQHEREAGARR